MTDTNGNTATCNATVTVMDNSAPSIVCNSITVSLDNNGQVVVNAADVAIATTDNCGGGQITYSLDVNTFTAVGRYTVTVTATDAAGNSSTLRDHHQRDGREPAGGRLPAYHGDPRCQR
ncbi:MAG: hypothetical protein IPO05_09435 [Flavobacteriales bacterium]|nr:hypothetical protein [Flavobacteriales bacterium]